ncbi:MAG: zf-HC2 domain-containing protein [Gemmatimonadaceae bacterium]
MSDTTATYDCDQAIHLLWDYLDGRLPDEARELVARHREECVECDGHFKFELSFLDAIRTLRRNDAEFALLRGRVLHALRGSGYRDVE